MAKSVNMVVLLGNIGRDAETRFMENGTALTRFSVATSRSYKQGDEWKEETEWTNISMWGKEKLAQYLTKGTQVQVIGRLKTRSWEDKDGQKKYATDVIAEQVVLCGGRRDGSGDGHHVSDEQVAAGTYTDEMVPF